MSGTISTTDYEAILDDIGALLRVLGLGDHARPASPHNVFLDEVLPAVGALRAQLAEAQAENGRLQEVADTLDQFTGLCVLSPPGPDSGSLCSILGDQDLWFAAMDALARYRTARDQPQGETNG
jgi:hypothetical protein